MVGARGDEVERSVFLIPVGFQGCAHTMTSHSRSPGGLQYPTWLVLKMSWKASLGLELQQLDSLQTSLLVGWDQHSPLESLWD